ncbi:MAG: RNA polymerase-binding transcription factor DksA [Alphaproteobacteria bacterium]|jgi:RNA polymerase-binding transcription factor DksA
MTDRIEKLLRLKEELSIRVAKIDKELHNRKTSGKFSDQVVDRQNDDVLLNLKSEAQQELEQINHALIKLENSVYGICAKCHGGISPERLDAIPFAANCKDCVE